jgi:hypothetical protein
MEEPLTITDSGRVVSSASKLEGTLSAALEPSHEDLKFAVVEPGARSISIGGVVIEVKPPKWTNPFVEPMTKISVLGNHIITTFGAAEILKDEADFNRSVTGEALIYFPSKENLEPVSNDEDDDREEDSKSDFFSPVSASTENSKLMKRAGDVLATALFIVPRQGDRGKSLSEVTQKLKSTLESADIRAQISNLRQNSLIEEEMKIEKQSKPESSKIEKKKATKSQVKEELGEKELFAATESDGFSFFETEIENTEKGFFLDENEDPDSSSGKKSWE